MQSRTPIKLSAVSAIVAALGITGQAHAQDPAPADVADLIGARASGGETQLENRGYTFVKSEKGSDRIWSNWWNARTRTCLSVVTYDGRFNPILRVPAADCNQSASAGSMGRPPNLADLVGARASGGEKQLEARGYTFVQNRTNAGRRWAYWFNRQSAICIAVETSDGRYASIDGVPMEDCGQGMGGSAGNQSPGTGGMGTPPNLADLVGARASGGEKQLEARGYTFVESRTGAGRRWAYWFNRQSAICIAVETSDGRYASINGVAMEDCERGMGGSAAGQGAGAYDPPKVGFARGRGQARFSNGCVVQYDVEVRPVSNSSSCTRDQLYIADDAVWEARLRLNTDIPLPAQRYYRPR